MTVAGRFPSRGASGADTSIQPPIDTATRPADGIFALAAKQLAVLAREAPRVMIGDDPDAVHDLRVATRRLQEVLAVVGAGGEHRRTVRRWRRMLRRVRQALGEWRNLDVVLQALKERRRRTRSSQRRRAWDCVRTELERLRVEESVRARKRLRRAGLAESADDAAIWLTARRAALDDAAIRAAAAERLDAGWHAWQDALAEALRAQSVAAVHAVRIATKRLRYRGEIVAALDPEAAQALLDWSRDLQQALGDWHDRQVRHEVVARVFAAPRFLLDHLGVAEAVLAEIRHERDAAAGHAADLPSGAALAAGEAAVAALLRRIAAA